MSSTPSDTPAYPGGLPGLLRHWDKRRDPLGFAPGETLPPLDCDLAAIAATRVAPPPEDPPSSENMRKSRELARELQGGNALVHLNALLIAHLRKRSHPEHTAALFHRIWAEQSDLLLREMDLRWKVSSLTTFGDHGVTQAQRSAGLGLSTLFNMMKLYESERLYSGREADRPFTLDRRATGPLPLDMNAFSLTNGGLDVNLIASLWQAADADAVIRPLAHDMLTRLVEDPRTVFRRLHRLRARKLRQANGRDVEGTGRHVPVPTPLRHPPRWGLVCTTNAPPLDVARFAAHHLDLGAARIHVFLDTPDPETATLLRRDKRITVTQCDAAYWSRLGRARPETHQQRQIFNATRTLAEVSDLDWLGHIDVDEFILTPRPFGDLLAALPDGMAGARLYPAEALATAPGALPQGFKLRCLPPAVPARAIHDIYPTFGSYLRGGFLSHLAGKLFARPGFGGMRLAIHRLRAAGEDITNIAVIDDAHLGHLHAPDWESFRAKLEFRQQHGSYRIRDDAPKSAGRLLAYLRAHEGEAGLRQAFDEVCLDTPGLRERLARHELLLTPEFNPRAAMVRVFGPSA
ncbi:glycosyltransferase family 2 protein [Marivita sp. GX14005]|uniref:glycosyltransferase family 2 protein n=1 Tax=Marivita sp. GX14005 TaxID=2942276 RepID=UPI002018859F|nr:glycosyltransferase family 2 protein [Marivita sp. GX14005]MCL3882742.1 glycosyltransferase family 2 protein [Marivita sp. GX14005]